MSATVHKKHDPRIDRRAASTRARLKQALVDLMQQKPYGDISVEEICLVAKVGRSTFYLHYAGKDDLKRRGFEEHLRLELAAHTAASGPMEGPFGFSLPILRHASRRLPLYRRLLGGPGEPLGFQTIEAVVREAVLADLRACSEPKTNTSAELAAFLTGAFMAVLRDWLQAGASRDVHLVDEAYRHLAGGALDAAIGPGG